MNRQGARGVAAIDAAQQQQRADLRTGRDCGRWHSDVIALGSIAPAYGADLSTGTLTAEGPNLPTRLGNVRVHLVDRQGVDRLAELFFVSPAQINFLVPADVPIPGYVIVNVENPGSSRIPGARSAIIAALAPELLTLDGTANGFAAATAIRIAQDGTQAALPVVDCRPNIGSRASSYRSQRRRERISQSLRQRILDSKAGVVQRYCRILCWPTAGGSRPGSD
jgi:hypothetical protein